MNTTPKQFLSQFQQDRNPSLHTLRAYETSFKLIMEFYATTDISKLNEGDIRAFITHLEANHNTRSTITTRLAPLKQYFKMLHDSGEIPATPFARIHYAMGKEEHNRQRAEAQRKLLTKKEVQKLLKFDWYFVKGKDRDRIIARNKMILHILADTGRRVADICRVLRKDIDFERLQIIFNHTKSTTGRGVSPITVTTSDLIRKYIDLSLGFSNPKWNAGYLIDILEDTIRIQISEAMTELGIKRQGLNAHAIDHFFISHAREKGVSVDELSEITGKSVKTLLGIYNHPGQLRVKDAHSRASVVGNE